MLAMMAKDKRLARLHDDLQMVMDIINKPFDMVMPSGAALAMPDEPDMERCSMDMACAELPEMELAELSDAEPLCCRLTVDDRMAEERANAEEEEEEEEEERRSMGIAPSGRAEKEEKDVVRFSEAFSDEGEPRRFDSSFFNRFRSLTAPGTAPTMHSRITPFMVERLAHNEIFVFGSNPYGLHNGGASKLAKRRFGAIQGQGEGRQGQSYAIPTIVGGVEKIRPHVDRFLDYAERHPELHFLVSRIGCGTAGFKPEDIAPLFARAKEMKNVSLPHDFWTFLR